MADLCKNNALHIFYNDKASGLAAASVKRLPRLLSVSVSDILHRSSPKEKRNDSQKFLSGVKYKELRLKIPILFSNKWALHSLTTPHSLRYLSTKVMTHVNEEGKSRMVDVENKEITRRTATATGIIYVGPDVARLIQGNNIKKGDVISIAKLAGIMAAKKTSDLIPLCHNITLNNVQVEATLQDETIMIEAMVKCDGKTGVEMEALTAVAVTALTVYDMCKAVTHDMCIKEIKLMQKTGGSRGNFQR